ncbi:MAG: phosphoglycerate kinase [Deltaproteobacteria bacterium]|nr:phosphoglycerate kinase [Deltaproteobacteria bacterium]
MNKKSVKDVDVKGKKLLMRVDFNVPLDSSGNITDDMRIRAALPTIEYVLDQGARLILMSHLGRPKGEVREDMRLDPVGKRLEELLNRPVRKLNDCIGPEVEEEVNRMGEGEVVLLENLRFHREETENNKEFARKLSSLGDLFVSDAFGTCHRAHASTEGVTHHLVSVAGFLVQKEIEYFEKINSSPEKPFALLLGGAKVADKIPVIENMLSKVDLIIIGGAMAYTFLRQKGINIGSSRYEEEMADVASSTLTNAEAKGVEVLLPVDHIVCDSIDDPKQIMSTGGADIEEGFMAVDIGPRTVELYKSKLQTAKTVVWNGPMGIFERDEFANGTEIMARAIADLSATSVIGGGDSAAAVKKFQVEDRMSHISTGGGASLEYLEGKVLPGIAALADK